MGLFSTLQVDERLVGLSLNQIFDLKDKYMDQYVAFYKEIFGQTIKLTEVEVRKYNNTYVGKLEKVLLVELNEDIKDKGYEFEITSLEEKCLPQVIKFYMDKVIVDLTSFAKENIKSLCSLDEIVVANNILDSTIEELKKEFSTEDETPTCDTFILNELSPMLEGMDKDIDEVKIQIVESIKAIVSKKQSEVVEPVKNQQEETTQCTPKENVQDNVNQETVVSDTANFNPPTEVETENKVVDVEFKDTSELDKIKKDLKQRIDNCVVHYYNKDRVLIMIGMQQHLLEEVMYKILEFSTEMDAVVENIESINDVESIKSKLSILQIDLATMINSYNPNITKDHSKIFESLTPVQVDNSGEPIVFEDFFGNKISKEDLQYIRMTPDSSLPFNNDKILAKYPEITELYNTIKNIGVDIKFQEVRSPYKYMSPIIQAFVFAQDRDLYRPFFIDTHGTIYNSDNKIIILPESGILEDGYVFDLSNMELLTKYIYGTASKEDFELADMVDDRTRSLNKILDLSSINPNIRPTMIKLFNSKEGQEFLDDAIKVDINVRFRLERGNVNDFILVSDSRVRKSFLQKSCKRQTLKIIFKDSKAELIVG